MQKEFDEDDVRSIGEVYIEEVGWHIYFAPRDEEDVIKPQEVRVDE